MIDNVRNLSKELKLTALIVALFYPTRYRLVIGYDSNFAFD